MKAIVYEQYGAPEVLQLAELPTPVPGHHEVRIRVRATAVNSGDVRMRKADPFAVRFMLGLFRPKIKVLGLVFAGEVEATSSQVTLFKTGDRVYGTSVKQFGTYAEFICLPENGVITTIPQSLSFEAAAAIPFGGTTALHFLRKAKLQPGQSILIYGASGAVGSAAVQLARHFGATVTAVCSTANVAWVKKLGADKVIDYTREDFSKAGNQYDVVLDAVGKSPFAGSVQSLKQDGYYLRLVHMSLGPLIRGWWLSVTSRKKVIGGVTKETSEDLQFLNAMVEQGKLRPVIDRTYPLEEIILAHTYVEAGHKKGNVVITV